MNLREGSRRLALLLGVLGFLGGCVIAYGQADLRLALWKQHREFVRVCSLTSIKEAMQKHQVDYDFPTVGVPDGYELDHEFTSVFRDGIKEIVWKNHGFERTDGIAYFRTTDYDVTYDTPLPSLWWLVGIPLIPVLGFLVPWVTVRSGAWVLLGFLSKSESRV